jgi:hypothetical protein
MKKKVIEVEITCPYEVSDILHRKSPEDVWKLMLHDVAKAYQGRDVFFVVDHYGYDGGITLKLHELREETDAEYKRRVAAEKKAREKVKSQKQLKDEAEFKEYQRLQKKFQGKSVFQ